MSVFSMFGSRPSLYYTTVLNKLFHFVSFRNCFNRLYIRVSFKLKSRKICCLQPEGQDVYKRRPFCKANIALGCLHFS